MNKYFYDTNACLELQDKIFDSPFVISSKTLEEIEHIKTSDRKDADIKYKARRLIRLLDSNADKYQVAITYQDNNKVIEEFDLPFSPDTSILSGAYVWNKTDPIIFVSDDVNCKVLGREIFGLTVKGIHEDEIIESYSGFVEVVMTEEEMIYFYDHPKENNYQCITNQYILIKDIDDENQDVRRWDGTKFVDLFKKQLRTMAFGDKIKPKDAYQAMVIDSLMNNTMTTISGKAGSGKSLLSLLTAMYLIDSGKYDRLVILFNPTPTKGAFSMGFYKGDMIDKAMQNSIGEILSSKFGDRFAVDMLISQGKLKLLSMADCRGTEIRDNEILYITEAQNTSVDLLKLCLSRASQGCKIIIEGDFNSQVDHFSFEGSKNGMKRAIDVLKGESIFGYVELQNVWRSKIAELAEKM